jgi:hypothetical protein
MQSFAGFIRGFQSQHRAPGVKVLIGKRRVFGAYGTLWNRFFPALTF